MKNSILIFIILFITISCSKNNDIITPNINTNNSSNGIYIPANYGHFKTEIRNLYLRNNLLVIDTFANAILFPTKVLNADSLNNSYGGEVLFNGDSLESNTYGYEKYGNFTNILNCNWSVAGSITTPSFTHNYNATYPSFTNIQQIVDSISLSNTFNINVNGASNYQYYYVIIGVDTVSIRKNFYSNGNLTFNPNEITRLSGYDSCDIQICFNNYTEKIVGSKNYIFHSVFVIGKSGVKIKP